MQVAHMDRFIASSDEEEAIASTFESHDLELDFSNPCPGNLAAIPSGSGIYLIIGRRGEQLIKVYVGKATDIRRRIGDYHRGFQVHCPNDRKLAMFQEWLSEADPGCSLSLCTADASPEELAAMERRWINKLKPLVNGTRHDDPESRAVVEQAFKWLGRP